MNSHFINSIPASDTTKRDGPAARHRAVAVIALLLIVSAAIARLVHHSGKPSATPALSADVRGDLIVALSNETSQITGPPVVEVALLENSQRRVEADRPSTGVAAAAKEEEFKPVHFVVLSGFNYRLRYEVPDDQPDQLSLRPLDAIPPDIKAYDGWRVKVSGFVLPLRTQARGVTEFLLMRDQMSCCFGGAAQMNHWIHVKMPRGVFRPSMFGTVAVFGALQVGERYENGSLISIYRMEAEKVEGAEVDGRPALPEWLKSLSNPESKPADER